MLKSKLIPFSETADLNADDVVSICPAQSEGYFYVWLRSKKEESQNTANNSDYAKCLSNPNDFLGFVLENSDSELYRVLYRHFA